MFICLTPSRAEIIVSAEEVAFVIVASVDFTESTYPRMFVEAAFALPLKEVVQYQGE
jgi:hypothetical protein